MKTPVICLRCLNEIDIFEPKSRSENYGGPVFWACPHCGKLYKFTRIINIEPVNDNQFESKLSEDDYGKQVIKDINYKTTSHV